MQRKIACLNNKLVIIQTMQGIQTSVRVQGQAEGRNLAYPFNEAGDGDRQERRLGRLLLWRFFLIDKSRTPSVNKKYAR